MRVVRIVLALLVAFGVVQLWVGYADQVNHATGDGRTVFALRLLIAAIVTAAACGAIVYLLRGQLRSRRRPDLHAPTASSRFGRISPPDKPEQDQF